MALYGTLFWNVGPDIVKRGIPEVRSRCRFVVIMAEKKDYFFYLYVVYFAIQGYLTLLAVFWYPPRSSMTPVESTIDFDYQVPSVTPLYLIPAALLFYHRVQSHMIGHLCHCTSILLSH